VMWTIRPAEPTREIAMPAFEFRDHALPVGFRRRSRRRAVAARETARDVGLLQASVARSATDTEGRTLKTDAFPARVLASPGTQTGGFRRLWLTRQGRRSRNDNGDHLQHRSMTNETTVGPDAVRAGKDPDRDPLAKYFPKKVAQMRVAAVTAEATTAETVAANRRSDPGSD